MKEYQYPVKLSMNEILQILALIRLEKLRRKN